MSSTIYIKGSYQRNIYQGNSGYTIGVFKVVDSNHDSISKYVGKSITFTGYFHELNDLDTYLFYGQLIDHPKYGEQFQVERYERCIPEEKDSIVEFLSSGLFKGIGEKKAKSIVDTLGKDTLKLILEQPNNLILIPGITKKNIDVLFHTLQEYESSYEAILKLGDMGFSTRDSMILYHFYKSKLDNIIQNDIYQIVRDIPELSFKKIDRIALNNGVLKDSMIRIKASILYIMSEISNLYGHCYFFYDEIYSYIERVLEISITEEQYSDSLIELEKDLFIIHREDRYYLKEMYEAETFIVKRIRSLNHKSELSVKKQFSVIQKIHQLEELFGIEYNKEQRIAIEESFQKDFLIITGGPGTGKTTILKGICELYRLENKLSYEQMNDRIALLAPTGRAAKRMSEATLFPASTIHRFLKWSKETNKFQVNEYNKSKVEFVLIDEASMIDTPLMASLLKGLSSSCKIVLIGDDHQLPSVGPGDLLHDFISSSVLPVVELTELYRQGKDSNIITLAYDIRKQSICEDIFNQEEDLTYISCSDRDILPVISEIASTYKDYSYKNFQILAPMYKGINGIDAINENLQKIFNPKDGQVEQRIGEVTFLENDKVIQLTNMPDDNVYNGDIGTIHHIVSSPKKEIYIQYDSNIVKYTPSDFNNFRLAYAISVHKAQGSEFDVVILPITMGYTKMLYQKLVYTAVTRAKKKLFLVGNINALRVASNNTKSDIRRTTIKEYFINGIV